MYTCINKAAEAQPSTTTIFSQLFGAWKHALRYLLQAARVGVAGVLVGAAAALAVDAVDAADVPLDAGGALAGAAGEHADAVGAFAGAVDAPADAAADALAGGETVHQEGPLDAVEADNVHEGLRREHELPDGAGHQGAYQVQGGMHAYGAVAVVPLAVHILVADTLSLIHI